MTTANKITILRILLIPFFVVEILYYVRNGEEIHRVLGVLCFATAAILDGRQPAHVSRQFLARINNLPVDWAGQREMLGFA